MRHFAPPPPKRIYPSVNRSAGLFVNLLSRLALTVLALAGWNQAAQTQELSSAAWQFQSRHQKMLKSPFGLLPYDDVFFLPLSYNNSPNSEPFLALIEEGEDKIQRRGKPVQNLETEFQLSFMMLLNRNLFGTRHSLHLTYTQQSWWQLYNTEWSRPFRETNYTPELFTRGVYENSRDLGPLQLLGHDFGLVHQSNGQIQELSRTWDRVFARAHFAVGGLLGQTRVWYRIPESDDDNPDIFRFLGYGDLQLRYKWDRNEIRIRYIPGSVYHSGEITYTRAINDHLNFYGAIFSGYGNTLIDYNDRSERIRLGISIPNPFNTDF